MSDRSRSPRRDTPVDDRQDSRHRPRDDRWESPSHRRGNFGAQLFTAEDLIKSSIPDIEDSKYHSSGDGLHSLWFTGEIRPWNNFFEQVQDFFRGVPWRDHVKPLAAVVSKSANDPCTVDKEHYICGAEISTSGRFVQNVLHTVTAVAKELGYKCAFGDWTTTADDVRFPSPDDDKSKKYYPDYCLLDRRNQKQSALLIGEGKHCWKLRLAIILEDMQSLWGDETKLRHVFGQILRDMLLADRKYGFLTTYKESIFLRIDEEMDAYVLNYSQAVPFTAKATSTSVSVRQCMLFLVGQVMDKNDYDIRFDKGKLRNFIATSRDECVKKTKKIPGGHAQAPRGETSLPFRSEPGKIRKH